MYSRAGIVNGDSFMIIPGIMHRIPLSDELSMGVVFSMRGVSPSLSLNITIN